MISSAEVAKLAHRLGVGDRAVEKDYFSEDLDFTLQIDLPHDELVKAFETLFPWLGQRTNLTLTLRSAEQNVFGSTTLLVNFVGPLKARLSSRHLKVDITRGELLLHPPVERPLLAPYSDYPPDVALPTYPLEEILTEKLCALMGRTEPRDLYDVYWLFEWGDVDLEFLPADFAAKCRHKG
jgi:predicted nucleotidyltransferase component of viral defense system